MAEFQEVMRQWKRRCEHCDKNEYVKCGINGYACNGFYKTRKHINPEFIEREVMAWAAEHPEPVYPTYGEWFVEHGDLVDGWQNATNTAWIANTARSIFTKHIPADIAQKLGIEPKEG